MKRSPIGSPPSSMTTAGSGAVNSTGLPGCEHQHVPRGKSPSLDLDGALGNDRPARSGYSAGNCARAPEARRQCT